MNVASLELCKELYELSGWHDTDLFYVKSFTKKDKWKNPVWELEGYEPYSKDMTKTEFLQSNVSPAYDLAYLLRKLPTGSKVERRRDNYKAWLVHGKTTSMFSPTPEDAAAKLAIELFKQGVLSHDKPKH